MHIIFYLYLQIFIMFNKSAKYLVNLKNISSNLVKLIT